MKLTIAALLAAGALCLPAMSVAVAQSSPYEDVVCTNSSVTTKVPSGVYVDKNGRRWVGFGPGGTPPDSLSKDSQNQSCTEVPDDDFDLPPKPPGPPKL